MVEHNEVNALTYTELVSERIVHYCKEKDITLHKLAILSGLGSSTIDNIVKNNTKVPSFRTVHRIAQGFDMTIDEFTGIAAMKETEFED